MSLESYLEQNPKTNLIFDFDGTMFKLVLPWDNALDQVKEELRAHDDSLFTAFSKGELTLSDTQNAYVTKFGNSLVELFRKNDEFFESRFLEKVEPNFELIEFVKKKSYPMYLWSSNSRETIMTILKKNKLESCFKEIITRDDVRLLKPVPEGFSHIYKPNNLKTDYLLIGDTDSDQLAAQNAGIDFYQVDYFKPFMLCSNHVPGIIHTKK